MPTVKVKVSLRDLSKMIDVSLLHPTMTDAEILAGLNIARSFDAAAACVKPYAVTMAVEALEGTTVKVCPVIGFPAGNSTTAVKVFEATEVVKQGAHEVDMVINVGKALSGEWDYVAEEIKQINTAVRGGGAILKVIFETDYLKDEHIIKLCHICAEHDVAFVKTSTGYGFVKQPNGMYNYAGATDHVLKLMRQHSPEKVQVKAAGGIRTLDDLLRVRALGITRVGATTTKEMLQEAVKRGIGRECTEVDVQIPEMNTMCLNPDAYYGTLSHSVNTQTTSWEDISGVIAGRRIANEYLSLGTLFTTGALAYGATKMGGSKKKEPDNVVDKVKSALGVGESEEESFIRKFIEDAEKEGSKH
ncbi:Deoxyribose-phosphate aldolase [Ceratobasidium theobromae]|uniref:deoxyribose-phosphate aldolase n=1 Tax=Ceratobasidium theobromae TaxID=1582974 RepID=A0A5N5QE76_9AGAM|nr:Deoxyribose-phosphate aldolase [Ceratobasidium theobromae]